MSDDQLSGREANRLKVKPNAFLYALEGTRAAFMVFPCILIISILFVYNAKGGALGFLILLGTITGCVMLLGSFVFVILKALGMAFIITNESVIARWSVLGKTFSQISIPINSIEDIEVRRYGARFGSVYFNAGPLGVRGIPPDILRIRPGWIPIWFSMPVTKPPLMGFWGFRHPETFAKLIVELQARLRLDQGMALIPSS